MNTWINANVIHITYWTKNLFSIILNASIDSFHAGQFTKLGLDDPIQKKKISRAYSYVNAPRQKNLEIYVSKISNGTFSNLLYNLKKNDQIWIKKRSYGFFTLKEIPDCNILWMFATGTAIGPYCSILQEGKDLQRFNHIVLIHAVKYQKELVYLPLMKKLHQKYRGKLKIQTILSRQEDRNSLTGRIPMLLKNQIIENEIGLKMHRNNSHVMLCGNPSMIKDTCSFLKHEKKMNKHLRRVSGHITTENYW